MARLLPRLLVLLSINNFSDFLLVMKLAHTYERQVEISFYNLGDHIEENLNYNSTISLTVTIKFSECTNIYVCYKTDLLSNILFCILIS